MRIEELDSLDDVALRVVLDPRDGGVDPVLLGTALNGCGERLQQRAAAALPDAVRDAFDTALRGDWSTGRRESARRAVVERLFWPLLYWNSPEEYVDLVRGEKIAPALFERLPLDGAVVCDIGAGAGRCTLLLAARARRVIAVDLVPQLLDMIGSNSRLQRSGNVETRRGAFSELPLADGSVDVAVACSSFTTSAPHGGEPALREAERITAPGGTVAVIWPQEPAWFVERGYALIEVDGDSVRHFDSVEHALRCCEAFYGAEAATWVRTHRSADVPYSVLGVSPPTTMCVKRV